MIYTADKFAAHLTARGARVSTYVDGESTLLGVRYGDATAAAFFTTDGRFQGAIITPAGPATIDECGTFTRPTYTITLKRVVNALGLPALTPAR